MDLKILSNVENIESVVSNFASELQIYIENMTQEVIKLKTTLDNLERDWNGDDYNKFKNSIIDKLLTIEKEIKNGQELKAFLEKTAQNFALMRKLYSSAGDN